MIDYNEIINLFDQNIWDFSYLTYKEIQEVLNFPIKFPPNFIKKWVYEDIGFNNSVMFLIVVKQSKNYDYSLNVDFQNICDKYLPQLQYEEFWCNYKYAAMLAGLGQYAKNSLFYHPKFQFETHLNVYVIHNQITNLPKRKSPNYNLLSQCENCNDCYNACPVNAIHNQFGQIWIDTYKCDNFCFFGNHPDIPSIKWNKVPIEYGINDKTLIYNIQTCQDFYKTFPTAIKTDYIDDNGQRHRNQYPICRECTSQPKCSKYNGNYPYDWNDVQYG